MLPLMTDISEFLSTQIRKLWKALLIPFQFWTLLETWRSSILRMEVWFNLQKVLQLQTSISQTLLNQAQRFLLKGAKNMMKCQMLNLSLNQEATTWSTLQFISLSLKSLKIKIWLFQVRLKMIWKKWHSFHQVFILTERLNINLKFLALPQTLDLIFVMMRQMALSILSLHLFPRVGTMMKKVLLLFHSLWNWHHITLLMFQLSGLNISPGSDLQISKWKHLFQLNLWLFKIQTSRLQMCLLINQRLKILF